CTGRVQTPLGGADADTTASERLVGMRQHMSGELGTGTATAETRIGNRLLQLFVRKRPLVVVDSGVAGCLQRIDGSLMHTLEEQEFDLALVQRGFCHE